MCLIFHFSLHTHTYIDVNIDINNFTKFETQIYDHYQQHALFFTFGVWLYIHVHVYLLKYNRLFGRKKTFHITHKDLIQNKCEKKNSEYTLNFSLLCMILKNIIQSHGTWGRGNERCATVWLTTWSIVTGIFLWRLTLTRVGRFRVTVACSCHRTMPTGARAARPGRPRLPITIDYK